MKKYKIGIVGYGDFTKIIAKYLEPYADIIISSRVHTTGPAEFGARFESLEKVLAQPIIIPSIPSQFFEEFFSKNKPLINPEALVVDVCSVKSKPLDALNRLLPKSCKIIGTHPLFGPQSIAKNNGLSGQNIVVCPVRIDEQTRKAFYDFLSKNLKLEIITSSAEQHDQEMAYVMGLSHYIARVMQIMEIPDSPMSTLAYKDLLEMKRVQGSDSWDLFQSILSENPYAKDINDKFKKACQQLDNKLGPDWLK